jgi:pantoate kinase
VLKASAFVPGHVTGFFAIHDSAKKMRHQGSRGAGICLSLGAHTVVGITGSSNPIIEVFINNREADAPVTKEAVRRLIKSDPLKVIVNTTLELPSGQGFGMSGAGALGACLALARVLDRGVLEKEVVCAAHEAEVKFKTGLGDVLPQSVGGIVIRKMEGCPPFGVVDRLEEDEKEVVLCVIGEELSTKDIITDPEYKRKITDYGDKYLRELQGNPSLEALMNLSYEFSKKTGLLSDELERAISAASGFGQASMSMLGNSVFALGDTDKLSAALEDYGEVTTCKIDNKGMRIE